MPHARLGEESVSNEKLTGARMPRQRAQSMALWLVPDLPREVGSETGPVTLLPGASVTVGKKHVDKSDPKLSKSLFRSVLGLSM